MWTFLRALQWCLRELKILLRALKLISFMPLMALHHHNNHHNRHVQRYYLRLHTAI